MLTREWAIHYPEIRKIEPMSSWRWEQFVENHSSNLAFQPQRPEASARRTRQENKLLLHRVFFWGWHAKKMYLRLYMAFFCRRTGLSYSLCFLTIQRGTQAFKMELGCRDAQSMLDCWFFTIEYLLKKSLEDVWVFQDQKKKQHC